MSRLDDVRTAMAADKGKFMRVLTPLVKGKSDEKLVNEILGGMFR